MSNYKKIAIAIFSTIGLLYICSFVLILFKETDVVSLICIIGTLLLLLFINARSGMNLKRRYRDNKTADNEQFQKMQKLLWTAFCFLLLLVIILLVASMS